VVKEKGKGDSESRELYDDFKMELERCKFKNNMKGYAKRAKLNIELFKENSGGIESEIVESRVKLREYVGVLEEEKMKNGQKIEYDGLATAILFDGARRSRRRKLKN